MSVELLNSAIFNRAAGNSVLTGEEMRSALSDNNIGDYLEQEEIDYLTGINSDFHASKTVATGDRGTHFHRHQRIPGTRPVISGGFFALTS